MIFHVDDVWGGLHHVMRTGQRCWVTQRRARWYVQGIVGSAGHLRKGRMSYREKGA